MLRDYQKEICLRISEAWKEHRSIMVQMPTGTGKTHLLASVVKTFLEKNESGCIWIVAHRRELVNQIEETVARYGIKATHTRVRVMSIQWLSRNREKVNGIPELIVVDEAHHALATTYAEVIKEHPTARILGLTATPCRLNCRGFTHLFDVLITSWSIAEFMKKGYLSLFDYVSIRANSQEQLLINSLKKRGTDGDYQIKEMDEVLNRKPSIERLYLSLDRFAHGQKGIVYAISIGHARRIAAYYSQKGMAAAAIDSKTPAAERIRWVEAFKKGEINVLVNVDVFSEGFDCPDVSFVQLARPTLSLSKYLQQVGRGLRKTKEKTVCTIIDNVGLYRIFGLPTQAWDWQSMFEGRIAGKGKPNGMATVRACNWPAHATERIVAEMDLEKVVSHEKLLAAIEEEKTIEEQHRMDEETKKERARKIAQYRNKGKVRLLGGDLLAVTYKERVTYYLDLQTGRQYSLKPVVERFGPIELLKIGRDYHSRTRIPYVNTYQPAAYEIRWLDYYLTITDANVPPACSRAWETNGQDTTGEACLLAGDNEQAYWLYRRLSDGSIVVRDQKGKYYHVEKGVSKAFIGSEHPAKGEKHYREATEELALRTEHRMRIRQQEEEYQKRLALNDYKEASPVRIGSKWGLKLGNRMLVPPLYRTVLPPVGKYCIVEGNPLQWGIIAVDGIVVINPQYPKVEISGDGTAILTMVTGRSIPVRLDREYDKKIKTL